MLGDKVESEKIGDAVTNLLEEVEYRNENELKENPFEVNLVQVTYHPNPTFGYTQIAVHVYNPEGKSFMYAMYSDGGEFIADGA